MKEMKCLDCDQTFAAETPKDMMMTMMPHYMADHADIMTKGTEASKEAWMKEFQQKWDATEEK